MRIASQFYNIGVQKYYVRSKLEYGAVVWNHYEEKYTLMIEIIQLEIAL